MKPAKFEFHAPRTLEETLQVLARYGEDARILAGGQSLVPLLNFRILQPRALISINHCPSLSYLRDDGDYLVCGAATRQIEAERSTLVQEKCPLLAAALPWVGGLANRNRGTVCGSLAHADPLAELPAVAVALNAQLVVHGAQGARTVAAHDFFIADLTTCLEPGEMLEAVRFPTADTRAGSAFVELGNRAHGFAVVGVAAHLEFDQRGHCQSARLAAIGVGATPVRLRASESAMQGADRFADAVNEAAAAGSSGLNPSGDFHADAAYKKEVVGPLVRRALDKARAAYVARSGHSE